MAVHYVERHGDSPPDENVFVEWPFGANAGTDRSSPDIRSWLGTAPGGTTITLLASEIVKQVTVGEWGNRQGALLFTS